MVTEKTWGEFRESGLLWFLNSTLHMFGWAIVLEFEDDEFIRAYPARVKFRGFSEEANSNGYIKVSEHLKENIDELVEEAKD